MLDTYVFTVICMDWIWTDSLTYTWKQHFQKFHSRESFLKVPLSVIIFIGYLWTEAISIENSCVFKWKQIHLDVALTIQAQRAPCAVNTCNFSLHNNESNVEAKRIEEMILNRILLKKLLIVKKILSVNNIENVWGTVLRIYALVLVCKGSNGKTPREGVPTSLSFDRYVLQRRVCFFLNEKTWMIIAVENLNLNILFKHESWGWYNIV